MPRREAFPTEVQEIVDSAYWRVVIKPEVYDRIRIPYGDLGGALQRCQVRLRGWYFPHLTNRAEEIGRGSNFMSTWSNFSNYEYWRFYQSAQLIHYHGLREAVDESYRDKMAELNERYIRRVKIEPSKIAGYVDIINFLYTITEYFEFAARLARFLKIEDTMQVEISIENIANYVLGVSDPGRAWFNFYQATENSLRSVWALDFESSSEPDLIALDAVEWFFQRFGWEDVNIEALKGTQSAFLRRRV